MSRSGGQDRFDRRKVAASRLWAANRFPYLASALFACIVVPAPDTRAVAVDESWRLYVDPALVEAWSVEELGSVFIHHAGHLLRDHAGRARALGIEAGSAQRWTLAADAEVNDDLPEDLTFPQPPVRPSDLGGEPGHFAEEYYRQIERPGIEDPGIEDPGPSQECGSGCHGQPRPWDQGEEGGIGGSAAGLLRFQVAGEIVRAAGRDPGSIPAGWERWASGLLDPKVDWRHVLAAEIRTGFAHQAGCVDYSYARPSRRASVLADVVLPSLRRPVPDVAIVCDTSGSMTEDLLGRVLSEVQGILGGVGVSRDRVRVLSCDADVHKVQRVSSVRQVQLFGGGGTNMGAGIDAAAALRPRPSVIVVLTDGFTPWPAEGPKGPRVVVGQVGLGHWPPPSWARWVRIDEVA